MHNTKCNCHTSVCNDSDVRLVQFGQYQSENKGRVEFCRSGRWGLVCYDSFSGDDWDNHDATVLCRQLGYDVKGKDSGTASNFTFLLVANCDYKLCRYVCTYVHATCGICYVYQLVEL